jgi:hypothetical protein
MGGWARLLGKMQRIDLASSLGRYRDEIEEHHDWRPFAGIISPAG